MPRRSTEAQEALTGALRSSTWRQAPYRLRSPAEALKYVDHSLWHQTKLFELLDGEAHGLVLYPLYMVMSFQFVFKAKLPVVLLALMFLAGFVPGLAFYMEYRVAKHVYPNGIPAKTP